MFIKLVFLFFFVLFFHFIPGRVYKKDEEEEEEKSRIYSTPGAHGMVIFFLPKPRVESTCRLQFGIQF